MTDVGTLADSDDPMKFDVPQLNNVYESAPYLHDGKGDYPGGDLDQIQ